MAVTLQPRRSHYSHGGHTRSHLDAPEALRHVPAHDALRQALHDGRLAYAALADELRGR